MRGRLPDFLDQSLRFGRVHTDRVVLIRLLGQPRIDQFHAAAIDYFG